MNNALLFCVWKRVLQDQWPTALSVLCFPTARISPSDKVTYFLVHQLQQTPAPPPRKDRVKKKTIV